MAKKLGKKTRKYSRKAKTTTQPLKVSLSELLPRKLKHSVDARGEILGAFAQVLSDVTAAAVQISVHVSTAPEYRNTHEQE